MTMMMTTTIYINDDVDDYDGKDYEGDGGDYCDDYDENEEDKALYDDDVDDDGYLY